MFGERAKYFILLYSLFSLILLSEETLSNSKTFEERDLLDLTLEELSQIKISSASLTEIDRKLAPASITYITQKDIIDSGARCLDELLDIMVPNLQIVRHNYGPSHVGVRGLITDRDNGYLYIVNGKTLNQKGHVGVIMERDLPMLGEIKSIEIIRGPGSTVYGPGALSGVINITTFSGKDIQGTEVKMKLGGVEEFASLEFIHGMQLGGEHGPYFMFYYGVTDYLGAQAEDSPFISSTNSPGLDSNPYLHAGHPVPYEIPRDRGSSRGNLKHKLHLQLDGDNFSSWLRYTRGGDRATIEKPRPGLEGMRASQRYTENAYQQLTLYAEGTKPVSDSQELFYSLSYRLTDWDRFDHEDKNGVYYPDEPSRTFRSYREDEWMAKLIYKSDTESVKSAFGVEGTYDIVGKDGLGYPDIDATSSGIQYDGSRRNADEILAEGDWETFSYAAFGEVQWHMTDRWILFSGMRLDKHEYTDWYVSPRVSLIYQHTEDQIWKLNFNQSIKRAGELELKQAESDGFKAEEENIKSLELSYIDSQLDDFTFKVTGFVQETEVWTFGLGSNVPAGKFSVWGGELELSYEKNGHLLTLSHSYTKLIDMANANDNQYTTAESYGYGSDLNTWSNHVTKFLYRWQINPRWRYTASARIYWGFPGAQDYSNYHEAEGDAARFGYDDNDAFSGSYFVNTGLHYQYSKKLTFRLNAYNILGWIDKDYNKRSYIKRFADYRSEAAAVGLEISYKF